LNEDGSYHLHLTASKETKIVAFLTAILSLSSPTVASYAMLYAIEFILNGENILESVPNIQEKLVQNAVTPLTAPELEMLITAAGGGNDGFASKVRYAIWLYKNKASCKLK